MSDASRIARALQMMEDRERNAARMRLNIEGGGKYNKDEYAGILSGGGRATLDIPVSDRLMLSPYFEGGGAYGSVETKDGKRKIRAFQPGGYGVGLKYTFD